MTTKTVSTVFDFYNREWKLAEKWARSHPRESGYQPDLSGFFPARYIPFNQMKPVDYPEYLIGPTGLVWSERMAWFLSPQITNGHAYVSLGSRRSRSGKVTPNVLSVNRLMVSSFYEPPYMPNTVARAKDGNPLHTVFDNIQWATKSNRLTRVFHWLDVPLRQR